MTEYRRRIINSLSFRIIMPVTAIILAGGIILYLFVLRSISDFADSYVRDSLLGKAQSIYNICDRSLIELLKVNAAGDAKSVRIKQALTLGLIEDFMSESGLKGSITENNRRILLAGDFHPLLSDMVEKTLEEKMVSFIEHEGRRYIAYHEDFEPWGWHIALVMDMESYSKMRRSVMVAYNVTVVVLLLIAVLSFYFFSRNVRYPINMILDSIRKGSKPEYKGIYEFELLSDNLRQMIKHMEDETKALNNIYHIAISKRGADFFGEVVMAVERIFGLNSLIARVNPDGETVNALALYLDGELKNGMNIPLKGSACEDVVNTKQMVVIERDAYKQFPFSNFLPAVKADSYIGFAVFNRKGDVAGIMNAFGKHTEFKESDIKVLQTIGQMVAIEIERLDEESEKEKMREQLYQSQKMEAVGTLAGGIAHDFNNILQGILGYASLLKMKVSEDDPTYKSIDIIENSATKAAELTKQLLGFARKGKYVVEPLNLNETVHNVLKIIKRTFDRAIEIKTTLKDDLWTVEGDHNQIENMILNLCLNARDVMPAGGLLHIETINKEVAADIPHLWEKPGRYAVIKITDTGRGMDEEVKKHIFEPFFTTKEKGKGTGMGLAMVYGVVKNHDGFITVDSEPGEGTSFTVFLPAVEKEIKRDETEVKDLPHGKGTILVVDDEEVIRNFAKETLESLGYSILVASNGEEAVAVYNSNKGSIDLVILDLIMPKMGGDEAFHRLKLINPDVRVLISTGFGIAEQTTEMMKDTGIAGFLHKPYNITGIAEAVKKALSSV